MTDICKNCGTHLQGKFCFSCGQKTMLQADKRLKHLVFEFFHHFTHLDSKFLKTLSNILLASGKITRDISQGITVPHFKLSALFLIGTIIYYLLPSGLVVSTAANESFKSQTTENEYRMWKIRFAENKARSQKISTSELERNYDRKQHDYGKLLTLIFIPLLIPILWILSFFIRKFNAENSFTAYDLGVASLEINSIILYGYYIMSGMLLWIITGIFGSVEVAFAGITLFTVVLLFLLLSFFRRAYQIKWWQSALCVVITAVAYIYLLHLFSLIAFLLFI